ncbi:MAG TPA: hypothetical protein VIT92_08030 [Burkholderiaceae bacterium]
MRLITLMLLLAFCLPVWGQVKADDPYNPYALNEQAMQAVRDGKLGLARILLERAVVIAPHDARLRRNLDALRDHQEGRAPLVAAGAAVTAAAPAADAAPPAAAGASRAGSGEPPVPLWPIK